MAVPDGFTPIPLNDELDLAVEVQDGRFGELFTGLDKLRYLKGWIYKVGLNYLIRLTP